MHTVPLFWQIIEAQPRQPPTIGPFAVADAKIMLLDRAFDAVTGLHYVWRSRQIGR